MKTLLEQSVYDALAESLARNGKALNDHFLKNLRKKITSSATTTYSGVEVKTEFLEWALEAIQRIVTINGGKYNSAPDKMLIYDLKEAIRPPDDLSGEEVTAVSFDADVDPAETTSSDVTSSAESLNVACSIAPDQQPITTEAYNYPPTPVAGEETGRPTQHYESFDKKFIWQIRDYNKVAEAPLVYWKSSTPQQKALDQAAAMLNMPVLKRLCVETIR